MNPKYPCALSLVIEIDVYVLYHITANVSKWNMFAVLFPLVPVNFKCFFRGSGVYDHRAHTKARSIAHETGAEREVLELINSPEIFILLTMPEATKWLQESTCCDNSLPEQKHMAIDPIPTSLFLHRHLPFQVPPHTPPHDSSAPLSHSSCALIDHLSSISGARANLHGRILLEASQPSLA